MHCHHCGQMVLPGACFCSHCGNQLNPDSPPGVPTCCREMRPHLKAVAFLNIGFGILGVLLGLGFFGFFSLLGTLIPHLDHHAARNFPFGLFFPGLGIFLGGIFWFFSLPKLIGGIGLLNFRPWARVLIILVSIFELFNIPIGTAVGIYSLWVLLSPAGEVYYQQQVAH